MDKQYRALVAIQELWTVKEGTDFEGYLIYTTEWYDEFAAWRLSIKEDSIIISARSSTDFITVAGREIPYPPVMFSDRELYKVIKENISSIRKEIAG